MKKSFLFAALVAALAMAFTACKNNANEPDPNAEVYNAIGELRGVMFDAHNPQQQAVITFHPSKNTIDVKFVQARIESNEETPKDIYIYNMPVSTEEGYFSHIQLVLEDGSSYAPFPKSYAYAAMNAERTTFNIHFGNDNEQDTQVYLVYGALLSKQQ